MTSPARSNNYNLTHMTEVNKTLGGAAKGERSYKLSRKDSKGLTVLTCIICTCKMTVSVKIVLILQYLTLDAFTNRESIFAPQASSPRNTLR